MNEYEHYSLFGESWWLDAVIGPGKWDEARIEGGGRLQARLPFVIRKKHGVTILGSPPLTQHLGPWFAPTDGKYATELARQKDLIEKLISRLPTYHMFKQNFHHAVTNWLPWYWKGFEQTTRYTYVLEDLSRENDLWNEMQTNIRGDIRKAKNRIGLQVVNDLGLDALLRVCRKTFQRQGKQGFQEHVATRVYEACTKRGQGKAFFAVDEKGQVHAAAYLVWDERAAYYLLGGGDPHLRNSGAHSLVVWEAVKHAAKVSRTFDFEGSMVEPVERFFRAFGARQLSYHRVAQINGRWLRTGCLLKTAAKTLINR